MLGKKKVEEAEFDIEGCAVFAIERHGLQTVFHYRLPGHAEKITEMLPCSPEQHSTFIARFRRKLGLLSMVSGEASTHDNNPSPMILMRNAVREACVNIHNNPNDSIRDIFTESLKTWKTGYWMDNYFNVVPVDN